MRISGVKFFNEGSLGSNSIASSGNSYRSLAPLTQDTVSFGSGAKVVHDFIIRPTCKDISSVQKKADDAMSYLKYILRTHLSDFIATDNNPGRPIEEMGFRIKTKNSILEKLAGRKVAEKSEIVPGLGDMIGARIVLRNAKNCDNIIDKFSEMVKRGYLKITEIENYATEPKHSYASQKSLKNLASACKFDKPFNKTYDSGYTALHLSVQLPDNMIGEIQIMGKHVEHFKDIEDILYKIKCNKKIKPEYKPIVDTLTQPRKDIRTDEFLQDAIKAYTKDQFIHARNEEISGKPLKEFYNFLPIPKGLPPEFDFNNLARVKTQCDNLTKIMSPEEVERVVS